MNAGYTVPRTCYELTSGGSAVSEPRPLADFRSEGAYVLLGDPGAGKTTAFQMECEVLGDEAEYLTVRHFLRVDPGMHPEWKDKILFIDGLDEVRAGQNDARPALDGVIRGLDALGSPRFRLSCRAADWLGSNDLSNLGVVAKADIKALILAPLTKDDIELILESLLTKSDPESFRTSARNRGLDGLLTNPQTLVMLTELVNRDEVWPTSRKDTFEKFCSLLAEEPNEERQTGLPDLSTEDTLAAAGRMCAIQLLSGASGYASVRMEPHEGYLKLEETDHGDEGTLRAALSTRLFSSAVEGHFEPSHRHLAEFVSARHIAALIDDGLPVRRVISLMTGGDGIVVTEMRGLSAWLAVQCPDARPFLMDSDPIGVCLYGDIQEFKISEKLELFESLRIRTDLLSVFLPPDAAESLTTPEMALAIMEALSEAPGGGENDRFILFLLSILSRGRRLQQLSEMLFDMILDSSRSSTARQLALEAFLHNTERGDDRVGKLKDLLAGIRTGRIPDPDCGLLGLVMSELYPEELTPPEIWDYIPEGGSTDSDFRLMGFWDHLTDDLTGEQIDALMDGLRARLSDILPALERWYFKDIPLKVVAHALRMRGDETDNKTLYEWLGTVKRTWWSVTERHPSLNAIREWLTQRPDVQKELILEGLSRSLSPDDLLECAGDARQRLCGADIPSDYGRWCLEQAVRLVSTRPWVAEYLLRQAYEAYSNQTENKGLSLNVLREYSKESNILKAKLEQLLLPPSISEAESEMKRRADETRAQWERQEAEELENLRSHKIALQENRAAPAVLYHLAMVYFGHHIGGGEAHGEEALKTYLKGDDALVQAALTGMKGTVDRPDIPSVCEILELREKNQMHYLGLPFLAGMAERCVQVPEILTECDTRTLRTALAFYFCGFMDEYKPDWYVKLLSMHPDAVADVQLRFTLVELKHKREYINKLFELTNDREHTVVASRIILPLLSAFPTRCRTKQLDVLHSLLRGAIQHADRKSLQELISEKTSRKSMNVAQRARWLAAGLVTSPEEYRTMAEEFAVNSDYRSRHLAAFFDWRTDFRDENPNYMEIATAGVVVGMIGRHFGPDLLNVSGWSTPEMNASHLARNLIDQIAASTSARAGETLDALMADEKLSKWRHTLVSSRDSQRVNRRNALYIHPTPERVANTLSGGSPSNPGDLVFLLLDKLESLSREIRRGNTDDWRQYWNEDSRGRPVCPKHEDHCRDALLSDIRKILPIGVVAQREGQYANNKRSDIRASYGSEFNVPVEAKKNNHRDLWTAIHDQLIERYTGDPDTGGYGIYLVFWFGPEFTQPPPRGKRPESTSELKLRLEQTLSAEQRHKITICVVDVARPG